MNFKFAGMLFFVSLFSLFMGGINGRNSIPTEMQQQKPTILTAKSIHGDIYDCVDVMKQPSLRDLPLVDYHKQKEILRRIIRKKDMDKVDDEWRRKIWLGEGCMNGTVPIPRKKKNGRHNLPYNITTTSHDLSPNDNYNGGSDVVGITVAQERLKGAFATISIHHPEGVLPGQSSSARVRLQRYSNVGQIMEFVEAGWTVNPDLYHDDKTRLYTRWQTIHNTGCYNVDCPGFVITSTRYPLNYEFPKISSPRTGEHHDLDIDIQMREDSNWYLKVYGTEIGYWRAELFLNLVYAAESVFAGDVYSKPPTRDSPPMGSGEFKGDNEVHTAYMQNVQVRLDKFFVPPPSYSKVERSRCYLAGWEYYSGPVLYGFNFLFGGTGGRAGATCIDG